MKQKWQRLKIDLWRDRQLYLFLLFPVIYVIVFSYVPMYGVIIAFKDYSARKGILGSDWVGLQHFTEFFNSYYIGRIIKNTLVLSIYSIIAGFPIPIIFALMLNSLKRVRFKKISQTITCMPNFISTVVMVGVINQLFNSRTGLYGIVGEMILGKYPTDLLGLSSAFRHLYVWSGVWQGFGWGSILYTAALAGVDPELHDAARIDGASHLQRVIHIDIPSIMPTIMISLIMSMGSIMSVGFEKVLLMQNGLNTEKSQIIATYVYSITLEGNGVTDYSLGTAIGLFNSVVNIILVIFANSIARKATDYSMW